MKLARTLIEELVKAKYKGLDYQLRRHENCFPGQFCRVTDNDKIHFGIISDIRDKSESNKLDIHCFVLKEEAGPAYHLENEKIFSNNRYGRLTITEIEDETDLHIFKNRLHLLELMGKEVKDLTLVQSEYEGKKDRNNSLTL